jgi:hypothetical protein
MNTSLFMSVENLKGLKANDGNLNWNDYDLIFPIDGLHKGNI